MRVYRPKSHPKASPPPKAFPKGTNSSIPPVISLGLAMEVVGLKRESLCDHLTGLSNRLAFEGNYAQMLSGAVRNGRSLAVAIVDIDSFKAINDTFGHKTGDMVMKFVARVLKRVVRTNDFVARWGGDEFVILLDEAGAKTAAVPLERIRKEIEALSLKAKPKHKIKMAAVKVTVSIGFATFTPKKREPRLSGKEWTELATNLFKKADTALYQAKDSGRNRVAASA